MASRLAAFVDRTRTADFRAAGACADPGIDSDVFAGDTHRRVVEAKKICWRCPVRVTCRDYATDHAEHGIWGATTEDERADLVATRTKRTEAAS